MAVSFVLALPVEPLRNSSYGGRDWFLNSCGLALSFLNLSFILQAMVTPLLLFLVPGPGSIFPLGSTSFLLRPVRAPNQRLQSAVDESPFSGTAPPFSIGVMIVAGCVCAGAIPLLWWRVAHWYAARTAWCPALFDLNRRVDPFHIDYAGDCQHYFRAFSVFTSLWIGVTAGALRVQSARAADTAEASRELRTFQGFYWAWFLSWCVIYRIIGSWLFFGRSNQEWEGFSILGFFALTVSSLWSLVFIRSLWKRRPRTWRAAILAPFLAAFLIHVLTALTFFFLPIYAGLLFVIPIFTLNLPGLAWGLFVGSWRWRLLQEEPAAAAGTDASGSTPTHSGLRIFELLAIGFGVLLLIVGIAAAVLTLVVLRRSQPHPY